MENNSENDHTKTSSTYGKRPLWQWLVVYVVIGGLVYGLVYYVVMGRKSGSNSLSQTSSPATQQMPTY